MTSQKWLCGVAGGLWLLSACASTEVRSIQPAADFQSAQIHKVLIISIASTPEIRKLLEAEFVRQWKARGVDAIASSAILPPDLPLEKASVAPRAKAQGFDTVLVTRLVKRRKIKPHIPQPGMDTSAMVAPEEADLTHYLNADILFPTDGIAYEVVVLRTNVYNVTTEQLEWSCVSNTLIAEDIPKRIKPFVKVILKTLYR